MPITVYYCLKKSFLVQRVFLFGSMAAKFFRTIHTKPISMLNTDIDKKKQRKRKWEHVRSPFTTLTRFNHLSFYLLSSIKSAFALFVCHYRCLLLLLFFKMFFMLKICKSCFYFIIDWQMLTVHVFNALMHTNAISSQLNYHF